MAKITIFGLGGTGKTTVGEKLVEILGGNYKFFSTGVLFNQKAKELGIKPEELEKKCIQNPEYDFEIDQHVQALGRNSRNSVVEGRLAYWFIPDSRKIKFICDDYVRIRRISQREGISFDETKKKTAEREEFAAKRFLDLYGIENLGPDAEFDLVLDTTDIKPDEVVKVIMESFSLTKNGQKVPASF